MTSGFSAWAKALLAMTAAAVTMQAEAQQPAPGSQATNAAVPALRSPFWPVGWTPAPEAPIEEPTAKVPTGPERMAPVEPAAAPIVEEWDEAAKNLRVQGVSRMNDGPYMALMEGLGVVSEGDTVAIRYKGLRYTWIIRSIAPEGITPERTTAEREEKNRKESR